MLGVLFGLMTTRLNKRYNYYCHLICHLCVTYGTRDTWDPLLLSHTTKQPDQLFSEDGLLSYKFSCCVCFFLAYFVIAWWAYISWSAAPLCYSITKLLSSSSSSSSLSSMNKILLLVGIRHSSLRLISGYLHPT